MNYKSYSLNYQDKYCIHFHVFNHIQNLHKIYIESKQYEIFVKISKLKIYQHWETGENFIPVNVQEMHSSKYKKEDISSIWWGEKRERFADLLQKAMTVAGLMGQLLNLNLILSC